MMCVETESELMKKGLLRAGKLVVTHVVLTPTWLIWAIQDGKNAVTAHSARLADIVVSDYSKSSMAKLVPDNGIEVTGAFSGVGLDAATEQQGTIFIGLQDNPGGRKFQELLIKSVQDVKK